jgi:hypothetical protein
MQTAAHSASTFSPPTAASFSAAPPWTVAAREAGAQIPPGTNRSACVRHQRLMSRRDVRPPATIAQPRASRTHQIPAATSASGSGHHATSAVSTSPAARTPITTTIATAATKPATRSAG